MQKCRNSMLRMKEGLWWLCLPAVISFCCSAFVELTFLRYNPTNNRG